MFGYSKFTQKNKNSSHGNSIKLFLIMEFVQMKSIPQEE